MYKMSKSSASSSFSGRKPALAGTPVDGDHNRVLRPPQLLGYLVRWRSNVRSQSKIILVEEKKYFTSHLTVSSMPFFAD